MKKILTSIALFGLLAAGCSNADNIPEYNPDDSNMAPDGASGYMAISIVTPRDAGSRATYDENGGTYENGHDYENKVEDIRFFFFQENKTPALVKKNPNSTSDQDEYFSYYDYKVQDKDSSDTPNQSQTVEKIVKITIALNGPKEVVPKYVIAVLNPNDVVKNLGNTPTMDALRNAVSNYQPVKKDDTDNEYESFIMSNSVYKDAAGQAIDYATIDKLYNTLEEAEADLKENKATVIYVERVAARLDLYVTEDTANTGVGLKKVVKDGVTLYDTQKKYKKFDQTDDQATSIYVKFIGWTVTSTPKKSNLLKHISTAWDDNLFKTTPAEPWNASSYYRSFWSFNPKLTVADNKTTNEATDESMKSDYQFFKYSEITQANTTFGTITDPVTVYMQENAALSDKQGEESTRKNHETKVIVAAQLLKDDGKTPLEIVEYGFKYYEKDELKEFFANQLPFYSSATDRKDDTHISKDDLVYKTQYQYINDAGVAIPGGYFSYITLANSNSTWYDVEGNQKTAAEVDSYLQKSLDNHLLIWENGQTYYYFTIRHLSIPSPDPKEYEDQQAQPGYYGVVRNHIYKANINTLVGLGTPVFDKDEIIYPEKPDRDGHIMAAEIRVLSWRVVSQGYEFSW